MTAPINSNFGVNNDFNGNEIKKFDGQQQNRSSIFEAQGSEQAPSTQKQSMPKLDYTSFPKKFRAFANELATRSQNEVKDLARDFNKNYPATPYIVNFVNYSDFPKPEDFSAKNLGGKEAAYYAWSSAVKEWVENCKQDMQSMKDTGIKELSNQISKGFIQSWINQGIAMGVILDTLEKHDNDMKAATEELKSIVQKEHAKTRGTVKSEATKTRKNIEDNADYLNFRLKSEGEYAREVVRSEGEQTRDEVEAQAVKTRQNIEENKQEEAKKNELREKINLALRNEPIKTKATIQRILRSEGKRFDNRSGGNNIADIVENMDLDTLQRIVDMLTALNSPWGR